MTTPRKATSSPVAAKPTPAAPPQSTTTGTSTGRKPWIKKTPVEVVLEQITKQEEKVTEMREAITKEERELAKLQQARKVLESD
ncbi:MAG: hypothetical protein WCA10_10035 [Terracidiphilus sp.]